MPFLAILFSSLLFALLTIQSWNGTLGFSSVLLLPLSIIFFVYGKKKIQVQHTILAKRLTFLAKLLMTIVGVMALLRHPIDTDVHIVEQGTSKVQLHSKAPHSSHRRQKIYNLQLMEHIAFPLQETMFALLLDFPSTKPSPNISIKQTDKHLSCLPYAPC